MPARQLLLVRHGESTWNRRGLVQGQTAHVPLTSSGHEQAAQLAQALTRFAPSEVWTSDQLRALQTARHIATAVGLEPRTDVRLRERSYGLDEGRAVDEVLAVGRPDITSAGGESFADVVARVGSFLEEVAAGSGVVVVVTHGDTLRAALGRLGVTSDRQVVNGAVFGPLDLTC